MLISKIPTMKFFFIALFISLGLVVSMAAHTAESMLRVACDVEGEGAEISINGQFKGQCPLDMTIQAGTLILRAEKKLGTDNIGLFEREIRVGDGVVQRVNVVLTRQQTEEGRKAAEGRQKAALDAYAQANAEYQRSLRAQKAKIDQCEMEMLTAAHASMMDCWTNSGGCVGPWPCENSTKRMQRCSSNGKGQFEASEFTNTCVARAPRLTAPLPPDPEKQ